MLVCAAAFLGIGAPAAGAATASTSYGYKGEDIGTPDSFSWGIGMFQPVAVSTDDDRVYLVRQVDFSDTGVGSVDVIAPDGTPVVRVPTAGYGAAVAVSSDGGNLFVTDVFARGKVEKYTSDGAPSPTYSVDPSWTPSVPLSEVAGMAVDQTTGDLVLAATGGIYRFDADSGALLSSFD